MSIPFTASTICSIISDVPSKSSVIIRAIISVSSSSCSGISSNSVSGKFLTFIFYRQLHLQFDHRKHGFCVWQSDHYPTLSTHPICRPIHRNELYICRPSLLYHTSVPMKRII
eukprot:UN30471